MTNSVDDSQPRIAAVDHFSQLPPEQLALLLAEADLVTYEAGATILDPARSQAIYSFLIEGRWWMARRIVGVEPQRIWIDDRPGNWHGGIAIIDKVAPPEVRAETNCTVLHVPRDLLDDLAAANPHLAVTMLRGISGGATMLYEHALKHGPR
jgi:signal-transduction protein with cAMP-binding, CBS, and nucleotidyltransferase domain